MRLKIAIFLLLAMMLLLIPFMFVFAGANEPVNIDSKTHAVKKPPVSLANPTVDFDYTGLKVIGLGGSGLGDFSTNTSSSVANEIVLFANTTGKLGKRSTGTGVLQVDTGVLGTVTIGAGLVYTTGTHTLSAATPTPTATATATFTPTPTATSTATPTATPDVSDTAFSSSWSGVTTFAPSKNVVYNQLHLIDSTDTGNVTTRIIPRTHSVASATSWTPNFDSYDEEIQTALAGAVTINAPTYSSTNEAEKRILRIKDNGTARAITWNAIYRAGTSVSLPTTTTISKTLYCGFMYNVADSKFDLMAYTDGY